MFRDSGKILSCEHHNQNSSYGANRYEIALIHQMSGVSLCIQRFRLLSEKSPSRFTVYCWHRRCIKVPGSRGYFKASYANGNDNNYKSDLTADVTANSGQVVSRRAREIALHLVANINKMNNHYDSSSFLCNFVKTKERWYDILLQSIS